MALFQRILLAHKNGETFRVLVCLPLLPGGQSSYSLGFEGDITASNAGVLRIQLQYEYLTIDRGAYSIMEKLRMNNVDPLKYIKFCGLRQHALLKGTPVTEIIYIHSKVFR